MCNNYYDDKYYKKIPESRYKWFYRRLAHRIYAHQHVLDIGCGTGDFLKACERRISVKSVTGMDISKKAIDTAFKRCKNANMIHAPIDGFRFNKGEKYDTITCFGVLEYVYNKQKALKNIHSICDTLGTVVIMVPIDNFLFRRLGFRGTRQRENIEDVFSLETWERMFINAGFEIWEKFIDRHNITIEWITEKGVLFIIPRLIMAILINMLPLKYTYQVFFKMRKKL